MSASTQETNKVARIAVVASALALIPALMAFAHFRDDSSVIAKARTVRMETTEQKYRQMMYDELDGRLGNR